MDTQGKRVCGVMHNTHITPTHPLLTHNSLGSTETDRMSSNMAVHPRHARRTQQRVGLRHTQRAQRASIVTPPAGGVCGSCCGTCGGGVGICCSTCTAWGCGGRGCGSHCTCTAVLHQGVEQQGGVACAYISALWCIALAWYVCLVVGCWVCIVVDQVVFTYLYIPHTPSQMFTRPHPHTSHTLTNVHTSTSTSTHTATPADISDILIPTATRSIKQRPEQGLQGTTAMLRTLSHGHHGHHQHQLDDHVQVLLPVLLQQARHTREAVQYVCAGFGWVGSMGWVGDMKGCL